MYKVVFSMTFGLIYQYKIRTKSQARILSSKKYHKIVLLNEYEISVKKVFSREYGLKKASRDVPD